MKLVIVITAFLIAYTQQQCTTGCLMCSTSNNCQMCDFPNNYILSGNSCVNATQTNCQSLLYNGNCGICNQKYYLDVTSQKCVAVSNTTTVANCLSYGSTQSCVQCNANYYISGAQCVAVNVTVSNCQYYSANGVCSACASGFMFNNDYTACVALTAISNCMAYSYGQCLACKSGFVMNPNLYLVNNILYSSTAFSFLQSAISTTWVASWAGVQVCQAVTFSNCAQYTVYNICLKCNTGYYLSTGNCYAFPLPIINGCTIYTSLTTCSQCAQGMFLQSSVSCQNIVPITNCTTYSQVASSTVCTSCITGYYVNNNLCAVRVNSLAITNCLTLSLLSDTCATCNTNYQLSTDARLCLASISSCTTYTSSTYQSTSLSCVTCAVGYYLTTTAGVTSCAAGTIQNCYSYQASANTCTQCVNGYYLVGQTCTQHVSITNCLTYDPVNSNTCSVCQQGFYTFTYQNVCQSVNVITNCATYNAAGSQCATCNTGYYLTNTWTCSLISPSLNCLTMSTSGICTECVSTYVLSGSNCVLPFDFITTNCDTYTFSASNTMYSTTPAVCNTCKQNNIPYSFTNLAICVQTTQLTYMGLTTQTTNCSKYSNAATPVCYECVTGYVYDQTLGTPACASSCSAGSVLVLDNLNGQINNCFATSSFDVAPTTGATVLARVSLFAQISAAAGKQAIADFRIVAVDATGYRRSYVLGQAFVHEVALSYDYTLATIGYQPTMVNLHSNALVPATVANVGADIANCILYISPGYTCMMCQWGYQLSITSAGVYTCPSFAACNTAVIYSGMTSLAWSITSCNVCNTSGQFVKLKMMFATGQTVYFEKPLVPTSGTSLAIDCVVPGTVMAGCAIYLHIYDDSAASVTDNTCLACLPNYKPTYDGTINVKITACTAITYASTTNTYVANSALACATQVVNGANVYYAFSDYTRTLCRTSSTANCFIVNASSVCQVCNGGYWLNSDNVCDLLSAPNCAQNMYGSPYKMSTAPADDATSQIEARTYYDLAVTLPMFGCSQCSTGYTRMMTAAAGLSICIGSAYIASLPTFPAGTYFKSNCQKYLFAKSGSSYNCKVCMSGYLPTYTYGACVTTISNCVTAQTGTTTLCYTCATGYNNVQGVCTLPSISNCSTYVTSNNPSPQLCLTCAIGYSLSLDSTTCTLGSIKYCSTYTAGSTTACTTCIANYALLNIANSAVYCYAIPATTNCATLSSSAGAGINIDKFSCTSCTSTSAAAYGVISWTSVSGYAALAQSICMPVQQFNNCATYDTVSTTISQNTFTCLTCNSGYYLYAYNNTCIQRKVQPTGCLTYSPSQDICTSCATGTFLNTTLSDQCVSYPSGIYNCLQYSGPSTCILCNSVSYLSKGICIVTTVVTNCATYSANYTCTNCASGFFLVNSTYCIQASAQNCLTYSTASACATCDSTNTNIGLQTANGVTSCVLKNVANCAISTSIAPFTCITCNAGYYPNSAGVCTLVTTTITNCLSYDSPTTCIKCQSPAILNTARTYCNSTYTYSLDTNCAQLTLLGSPICSQCQMGFYFSSGNCVACATSTGCLTCSSTNSTSCLICTSGYDMNLNSTCTKRAVAVSGTTGATTGTSTSTGTTTTNVSGANRWISTIVAILLLLGLF